TERCWRPLSGEEYGESTSRELMSELDQRPALPQSSILCRSSFLYAINSPPSAPSALEPSGPATDVPYHDRAPYLSRLAHPRTRMKSQILVHSEGSDKESGFELAFDPTPEAHLRHRQSSMTRF